MTMTTETTKGDRPTHDVFVVRDGKEKDAKGYWTRVGAMWPAKNGYTVQLDCVPLTGRLVILPVKDKNESAHTDAV